jgi:sialidase-1
MLPCAGFIASAAAAAAATGAVRAPALAKPTAAVLHEVELFHSGESGVWCFRVPTVVALPWGPLLAFAEARQWIGDGCYPHGTSMNDTCKGTPKGLDCTYNTSIVMKTSVDRGLTWGPLQNITRGHDFSVLLNRVRRQLILQYPSGPDTGTSMQSISAPLEPSSSSALSRRGGGGGGITWGHPTALHTLGRCSGFNVGPGGGGGVQLRHSTSHPNRLVFCGHGNSNKSEPRQRVTCTWVSDNNGSDWVLTSELEGFNECNLVELEDGTILLDSRNQVGPTNPVARSSCNCRLSATSTDGGSTFADPTTVPSLSGSSCQGSMIATGRGSTLYYTGPNTRHPMPGSFPGTLTRRANMTLSRSNGGRSWQPLLQLWAGEAEYSSVEILQNLHGSIPEAGGQAPSPMPSAAWTPGRHEQPGADDSGDVLAVAWERDSKQQRGRDDCTGICTTSGT